MGIIGSLSPADIRQARADNPKTRDRDLADQLGISEAQLVAAHVGRGATAISADPNDIMPRLAALGEVMALTRNASCVIEKAGFYDNFHPGANVAMILSGSIDLRLFGKHFVTAFAVERGEADDLRRSIQIFDAAGDAVHKVHLRPASNHDAWADIVAALQLQDQVPFLDVAPRQPVEGAKADPAKAGLLRSEWARLTDTHQFMRLTSGLKMNRLGAYRIAGAPLARPVVPSEVNTMLQAVRDQSVEVMIFVGNRGCIEIHGGPILNLREMGPWQNVLDPGFDLHLRLDHIAEVWAVDKPTQRGPAISIEAFDADGSLILQVFGRRTDAHDHRPAWNAIVETLATLPQTEDA